MKKKLLALGTIGLFSLAAIGYLSAQTMTYNETNFNAFARKSQPMPAGHVPGRDNGAGQGLHNSGEDCGMCHTQNGKAGNVVFTVGGTIYEDRAARRPLKGAEVVLQDVAGKIISMTTNEAGNFWTFAPITSNPYTIGSHSGITDLLFTINPDLTVTPINPADSRSWLYKAWVKNPDGAVRQMVTIAPIGGSTGTSPRMGCNMHHSPFGSTGAAWASRKSSLASYPKSQLSFKKHILPIFVGKCAPCHVPGLRMTRLVTMSDAFTSATMTVVPLANTSVTAMDYSGGKDLTSYSGSTVVAAASGVTTTIAKTGIKDETLPYQSDPDASPVLLKTKIQPGGTAVHPGGTFWTAEDADYKAIRQWIAEGALNN